MLNFGLKQYKFNPNLEEFWLLELGFYILEQW